MYGRLGGLVLGHSLSVAGIDFPIQFWDKKGISRDLKVFDQKCVRNQGSSEHTHSAKPGFSHEVCWSCWHWGSTGSNWDSHATSVGSAGVGITQEQAQPSQEGSSLCVAFQASALLHLSVLLVIKCT